MHVATTCVTVSSRSGMCMVSIRARVYGCCLVSGSSPHCVEALASGVVWVSRLWYLPVGYLFPNRVMIVAQSLSLCKHFVSSISMCIPTLSIGRSGYRPESPLRILCGVYRWACLPYRASLCCLLHLLVVCSWYLMATLLYTYCIYRYLYLIPMLLPPVRCKGSHHISPLSLY